MSPLTEEQEALLLKDWEDLLALPLESEDGTNLESAWHRSCINLLIASIVHHLSPRKDFYAGGNMFIYFDRQQAMTRNFRGPDFFWVRDTNLEPARPYWAVWHEGGLYPDVIIELTSPTTAEIDHSTKYELYEQRFKTQNYYCFDPLTNDLVGWERHGGRYRPLRPDDSGRLFCSELGLWLGTWEGEYLGQHETWLRFFDTAGNVVPTPEEAEAERADKESQRADKESQRADKESQRADKESQRAGAAEAEVARLLARLKSLGQAE
jgi:Uma2 family endonuclease